MRKKYIKPETEMVPTQMESLMNYGSEVDENGNPTGHIGQGEPGTEDTENGEVTVDAKPFGHGYSLWDE